MPILSKVFIFSKNCFRKKYLWENCCKGFCNMKCFPTFIVFCEDVPYASFCRITKSKLSTQPMHFPPLCSCRRRGLWHQLLSTVNANFNCSHGDVKSWLVLSTQPMHFPPLCSCRRRDLSGGGGGWWLAKGGGGRCWTTEHFGLSKSTTQLF